eukprot:SAG11_NODE_4502_length_1872_cov_16.411168_2_plen_470_part_00
MGGGRERGVVRNDRTNIQDIWRQNRSPQGANVAGAWERGAEVKGEGQNAEVPGKGTKRDRADDAEWARGGGEGAAAAAPKRIKPDDELKNLGEELRKLREENEEVETMLSENDAVQELQRLRTENKNLKEIMILDKLAKIRAEQKLIEHLNRIEWMAKIGNWQKTRNPDGFRFVDLFQRWNLCSKWYIQTHNREFVKKSGNGELAIVMKSDGVTPLSCERMGPCPYAHSIEERDIEVRLHSRAQNWKTKPCDNYKDGGCCFPGEICFFWHWEEDVAKDLKLRCFGNVHKSRNCAKGVLAEHCQEIVKSTNQRNQEDDRLYAEGLDKVEAREKRLGKEEGRKPYDKLSNRSFAYFNAVKKLVKAGRLTLTKDLEFDATEMIDAFKRQESSGVVNLMGQSWRNGSHYLPPVSANGNAYTTEEKQQQHDELSEIKKRQYKTQRRSPRNHASNDYRGKYGGAASEPEAEGPSN